MPRIRLGRVLLASFVLVAVALSYWRLFYGVDFTDEAWYTAVPYRFVLGQTPYVDEVNVPQMSVAMILYPFIDAYHALVGRTGIVLFVRHLHFLVAAGVGIAVGVSLRRAAGAATATLAGVAAFTFLPFDIPSVSYNSLGSGLFTAGTLLGYLSLSRPSVRPLAGICLGLAAFAYPPLIVAVAAGCAIRLRLLRSSRSGEALRVTLPALAIPLAGFAGLAALAGPHQVIADYRRSSHYLGQAGGLTKIHDIAKHLWTSLPLWYLLAAGLLLLAWSWWRGWKQIAAPVLVVLPLTMIPPQLNWFSASLDFVAHAGWIALPLLYPLRARPGAIELFSAVWIPALFGGALTSYSSSNGGINFGVGFFPALVVTLIFSCWSIEQLTGTRRSVGWTTSLVVAVLILFLTIVPVYRDGSLLSLRTQITSGPFAGLFTSRSKQVFLRQLGRDLSGVDSRCRIAFFNDFPAGYLLTDARPDTNALWISSVPKRLTYAYREEVVRYYLRHGFPDVVVVMKRVPFAPPRSARRETYPPSDPLLAALRARPYRVTASRLDYVVYRRRSC